MGKKTGDNAQVLALAEALGWPFEVKHFVYQSSELLSNLLLGATLAGIVNSKSSPLKPPWPDLIITAGRRNEPVARWIRRQSRGRLRIVHIGRPWARLEHFDLIITTPQYRLPERPNVLHNHTTLHRVTEARLAEAAAAWGPRFAHLPRPFIGVLVGGHSGPYTLDALTAARLATQASTLAMAQGGSLLVTTSARTPPEATDALIAAITTPAYVFRWTANAEDNPYYAYLALAERFIVTGESISMLTEACATQKPLYIFPFGQGTFAMEEEGAESLANDGRSKSPFRFKALTHHVGMRWGPRRLYRDVRTMHRWLIATGRAVWLGQPFPPGPPPAPLDDTERAVERVKAFFSKLCRDE